MARDGSDVGDRYDEPSSHEIERAEDSNELIAVDAGEYLLL